MTFGAMDGLQIYPIHLQDAAVSTLGAGTALIVNSDFTTNLTRTFLLKQVQYALEVSGGTSGQGPLVVGLAMGLASVAEIGNALEDLVTNPNDPSSQAIAGLKRTVLWETVRIFQITNAGNQNLINEKISIGGGKGIPALEEAGLSVFVWNPANASLSTGTLLSGLVILKGVWMND